MRRIRDHLTYANVMATIAVFLVLSGGTAVALSGSNTVFSDDIVDNQVLSADVRDDTLSSGGLHAADLAPNSVGGTELQDGPLPNSTIVARARGGSSVSTGNGSPVAYPLSGNTWTQAANESDFFPYQVGFNAPSGCQTGVGYVNLVVDGKVVARGELYDDQSKPGLSNTTAFAFDRFSLLFEPGAADARTLTATVQDDCGAGESFTVTSLKVNVVGFR